MDLREKERFKRSLHLLCAACKAAPTPGLLLVPAPMVSNPVLWNRLLNSKFSSCRKKCSPAQVVLGWCSHLPTVSLKIKRHKLRHICKAHWGPKLDRKCLDSSSSVWDIAVRSREVIGAVGVS